MVALNNFQRVARVLAYLSKQKNKRIRRALVSLIEKWQIESCNVYGVNFANLLLKNWFLCPGEEDAEYFRDAFSMQGVRRWLQQLKLRVASSGNGVCIAIQQSEKHFKLNGEWIINPMYGVDIAGTPDELYRAVEQVNPEFVWGRDMKFTGDLYNCLSQDLKTQRIIPYSTVRSLVDATLSDWRQDGKNLREGHFKASTGLSLVRKIDDADHNIKKILSYIDDLPSDTIYVPMIDPPDYVMEVVKSHERCLSYFDQRNN